MKKDIKGKLLRRLKIVEGQVRGLQGLVEKEEYCIDIITQTSAIRHALSSVEDVMLENHLETHVVDQMRRGQEKKAISEILNTFKKTKKK